MFMKLAPDTVRLRRMARARAAGEISELEYREARRDIIDHFLSVAPSQNTTRRRGADDDLLRQPDVAPLPAGAAPAAVASRRWLWLALLAGLLVCVVVALL